MNLRRWIFGLGLAVGLLGQAGTSYAITECPAQSRGVPGPHLIYFAVGSAKIDAAGMQKIRDAAKLAKDQYITKVCIRGKADKQGNEQANQALSLKRAQAVADALIREGVKPEYILVVGKGEAYGDWLTMFQDSQDDRSAKISLSK